MNRDTDHMVAKAIVPTVQIIHGKRVVTSHICPPIPFRSMDWCAYFDGEEERGGYGYGSTEAEAIADFINNLDDEAA